MMYTESEQLVDYQTNETWSQKVEVTTKLIKDALRNHGQFTWDGVKYDTIFLVVDSGYLDDQPWHIRMQVGLFSERSYHLVIRKRS